MKYLILLLMMVITIPCYGQFFNGTIQDIENGRVQEFRGQVFQPYLTRHEEIMEGFRRMAERREAIRQRNYQEEQLRLLRKIANEQLP